jgi:hypothetical protein
MQPHSCGGVDYSASLTSDNPSGVIEHLENQSFAITLPRPGTYNIKVAFHGGGDTRTITERLVAMTPTAARAQCAPSGDPNMTMLAITLLSGETELGGIRPKLVAGGQECQRFDIDPLTSTYPWGCPSQDGQLTADVTAGDFHTTVSCTVR